MKRTPLSRRAPLRSGGRLRAISPKKLGERAERRRVVERVRRRDGDRCQAQVRISARMNVALRRNWPTTCAGPLDPHEIVQRSVWRAGYLVDSNVIMVCRRHHDWIDAHQIEAMTLGLHAFSWQRRQFGGD